MLLLPLLCQVGAVRILSCDELDYDPNTTIKTLTLSDVLLCLSHLFRLNGTEAPVSRGCC